MDLSLRVADPTILVRTTFASAPPPPRPVMVPCRRGAIPLTRIEGHFASVAIFCWGGAEPAETGGLELLWQPPPLHRTAQLGRGDFGVASCPPGVSGEPL